MLDGTPEEVFRHYKELEAVGLAAPQVTYVMHDLKEKDLMYQQMRQLWKRLRTRSTTS